jgi:hypothetical protein
MLALRQAHLRAAQRCACCRSPIASGQTRPPPDGSTGGSGRAACCGSPTRLRPATGPRMRFLHCGDGAAPRIEVPRMLRLWAATPWRRARCTAGVTPRADGDGRDDHAAGAEECSHVAVAARAVHVEPEGVTDHLTEESMMWGGMRRSRGRHGSSLPSPVEPRKYCKRALSCPRRFRDRFQGPRTASWVRKLGEETSVGKGTTCAPFLSHGG